MGQIGFALLVLITLFSNPNETLTVQPSPKISGRHDIPAQTLGTCVALTTKISQGDRVE
jgi:hypothetical protein